MVLTDDRSYGSRVNAEYRFTRDNAEIRFLDWRDMPADIAVLPELTFTPHDVSCLVAANNSTGRRAA